MLRVCKPHCIKNDRIRTTVYWHRSSVHRVSHPSAEALTLVCHGKHNNMWSELIFLTQLSDRTVCGYFWITAGNFLFCMTKSEEVMEGKILSYNANVLQFRSLTKLFLFLLNEFSLSQAHTKTLTWMQIILVLLFITCNNRYYTPVQKGPVCTKAQYTPVALYSNGSLIGLEHNSRC